MARPLAPAVRAAEVEPFHVMRILARARELEAQGRDIVHMEVGEPDFPTPEPIVEAGRRALADGHTRYTPAAGLPALREAIAGHYAARLGLQVSPGRILVTPGASGALTLVLAALLDPGDEVLLADPGYPCYRHMVSLLGGRPRLVPLAAEQGFAMTPEDVAAAWSPAVRVVLVASPANPTGTVLDPTALAALYDLVRDRGAALVVDEIYQGIVYDAPDHSALAAGEDGLFVVNSFSKYFGMTGWRLGWAVGPTVFAPVLDRLAQNLYLAASTPAQYAALAAFPPETLSLLDSRKAEFLRRRDYLLAALEALGIVIPARPGGAFYVYADCSAQADDAESLAKELLELGGVATTPGTDFGCMAAGRYLRLAYTTRLDRLAEGMGRMKGLFEARGSGFSTRQRRDVQNGC
jgi:aspartate/methionine/tyrosine aminotransferase